MINDIKLGKLNIGSMGKSYGGYDFHIKFPWKWIGKGHGTLMISRRYWPNSKDCKRNYLYIAGIKVWEGKCLK